MACYLLALILLQMFALSEELRWITETSQITKCVGQSAHIIWKYVKEDNEEIRQHQWYFNNSLVIATSSVSNGFVVEPPYKERVKSDGETGIWLKNVSTADTGNYTLYPRVAWEKNPSEFSIFLNITERSPDNSCRCERMPVTLKKNINSTFTIEIDGCYLQINSSYCCPIGLALECYEGDSNKLCITISNQETETTIPRIVVTDPTDRENFAPYPQLQPLYNAIITVLVVCILQLVIVIGTSVMFIVSRHCRILGTTMSGKKLHTSTFKMVQSGPRDTEEYTDVCGETLALSVLETESLQARDTEKNITLVTEQQNTEDWSGIEIKTEM